MVNLQVIKIFIVVAFTLCFCECKPEGDIYSAVSHMEPLVDIERRLVKAARSYLDKEKEKLSALKQFAQSVEEAMELSKDDPQKYLGNPVNSYLIIKRFTSGWSNLGERLTIDDKEMKDVQLILKANEHYLPTFEKDLVGATHAVLRLQDTYEITAREMADGRIQGTSDATHELTAEDCMDIANIAHQSRRYVRMKEWLLQAERIVNDPALTDRRGNATAVEVNEFLAWAHYLSNDMKEALRYTELVLHEDASHESAIKNHDFFKFYVKHNTENWLTTEQWDYKEDLKNEILFKESKLTTLCTKPKKTVIFLDPNNTLAKENQRIYSWYVRENRECKEKAATFMTLAQKVLEMFVDQDYVKACRLPNPTLLKVKHATNLVCFVKNDSPLLILKPVRVTRVHDNPEVLVFHEMVTDGEIKKLKNIAIPRMENAKIVHPENNEFIEAGYRIAKTTFLNVNIPQELHLMKKIYTRLSSITNLDLSLAEPLQLNNYGLGGQYEFHHDHGHPGSILYNHENGNRIATVLFYLSDVEKGGETVFTKLGLSIPPKKGDAVFWHNLFRNGTGIWDTEHASCPVVSGSKWVANAWIHAHGNEFKRKCAMKKLE